MTNLELLKDGYAKFAVGDVAGAVANWAPDIEWDECSGFPFVTNNGKYVGVQAVIGGVFSNLPQFFDGFGIEITDFVDGGDKIVMVGYYTGTLKASGRKFRANATHVWTLKNGKAVKFFQAVDTAEIFK